MIPRRAATAFALCVALLAPPALAASASALLGEPARNLAGERIGTFEDLVIDARAARVLYVIVDRGGSFVTLPARALDARLRLDMGLAGAVAYDRPPPGERFRRAAPLNPPDRATFYGGGAKGYTDYPSLAELAA